MGEEKAITVIEQRAVAFYGDELTAVRGSDGLIYVPLRPICDLLGLDWSGQRQRIQRDAVLSEVMKPCVVVTPTQGQPAQRREMLCLPLDYISGFLFGINVRRVKKELQERLIRYQRECYQVLSEAFLQGRLTADPSFSDLVANASADVAEAYYLAQAVLKLAQNQLLIESRLENHENRLEALEAQLGNDERHITEAQASQLSQAVKTVAMEMKRVTGRNEFGAVYGELYRKFNIAEYRRLPAQRFDEAMDWLNELRQLWQEKQE